MISLTVGSSTSLVDVSKCIYFQQEDEEYTCGAEECNGAIVACRACDNCYYKQLKRKEQECEELKAALNEGCLHNLTLMTEQRVLLQTLTEIKEIAEGVKVYDPLAKQILQKISECEV